jgi:CheY-like chemotaxis protein
MSFDYLHYVASYKKNIKDQNSKSDKHISLRKKTSARTLLHNNKNLTKVHPNSKIKKNKKYQVLLAESNSGVRAMIKLYLESLNLDYIAVDTGDEALHLFSNTVDNRGKNYDVVLLDTHLDGLSGLEVAIEIHKQSPDQRIMIMSASPREHLSNELLKSTKIRESDIFARPFRLAELICSIEPIP